MLILASSSPRRKKLLTLVGRKFKVVPASVDESALPGETTKEYVLRLATNKAGDVASRVTGNHIVIAADTTVVFRDKSVEKILGKPLDADDAENMLQRLRGCTHNVYTALAIINLKNDTRVNKFCTTAIQMRDYTDAEIKTYIASGDPLDKAGSYAIQHTGFNPVKSLNGCYANVVGLPLCHLTRALMQFKVSPVNNVPNECQSTFKNECTIYHQVLTEGTH